MPTSKKSLPVHRGHWLWKSTLEIIKDPLAFYSKCMKRFGDTFYISVPFGKAIITGNPDLIQHVLQHKHKNFPKDKGYDQLALLLGKGLVTSKGELWKKQRRIAQPTFHKKSLEKLFQAMGIVAEKYFHELDAQRGKTLDISKEMMAVTAKIAMKALFSTDMKGDLLDIYDCISFSQEYAAERFLNPIAIPLSYINGKHRKFKKQKQVMDNLIYGLIEQRKATSEKQHDFLQMLMDARYEDTGEPMSELQLRDELVTIFSAGHETSANGLSWTLYLLAQHPEIVEKISTEVTSVLGNKMPGFEDLKQLVYTRQVIEEGMRLYPPVWGVGRVVGEPDEWQGHTLEPKTVVATLIYLLHRNPELWEDPEKFDPDRFTAEKVKERPRFQYIPFGAGPRMCIGNHFAMMEMQLLLAILIRDFDFELIENQKIVTQPLVTLRPKYGIKMKVF